MSENTPLLSVDLPAELRQRQSELAQLLLKHCPSDGVYGTAVDPLALIRADGPTLPARGMHKPALCIIAQGRKEVQLAEERYIYDPLHYLVVSVTLPLAGQVIDASPDAPYLCVRLDIDPAEITQLISDAWPLRRPYRRQPAGCGAAPDPSAGQPARHPDAGAADPPRDFLPAAAQRPGPAPARDRHRRQPGPPHHPRHRLDQPELRQAAAHRATGPGGQPQPLDPAPPLQGRDRDEPVAVPEAAALAGSAPADLQRGPGSGRRRLPGRLRKPIGCSAPRRCATWRGRATPPRGTRQRPRRSIGKRRHTFVAPTDLAQPYPP